LLPELEAETLIADKAFDADPFDADQRVLAPLAEAGKAAVIPPVPNPNDTARLRQRPLQGQASDRELLRQAQAVPGDGHPLPRYTTFFGKSFIEL
jgi:hypothetical protein